MGLSSWSARLSRGGGKSARLPGSVAAKKTRSWRFALRRIPPRDVASLRCSARMMTGPGSNALVETVVVAVPVWASMMSAARTARGTAFHVRGMVVDAIGNACYAPGSKCCKPEGPRSAWYPVSTSSACREASVMCSNRNGDEFECAAGDRCCGDICVSKDDVCCENVYGNNFPCRGDGGGCCGNGCYAPGTKCCKSPWKAKARWYPVTMATKCAF